MRVAGRPRAARLLLALAIAIITFGVHPAFAAAAPSVSIGDVSMNEGNSATTNFTFTVTLSDPPPGNFTINVNFQTNPGTATAGAGASCPTPLGPTDYLSRSGQLTFNRNNLTRTVAVPVCGDTVPEPDETFFVDLSNPTGGAVIAKSRGTGTIRNDDGAFSRPTSTSVSCDPLTVGISASCTATVTDTGSGIKTTPTGTVSWSSSPAGTFVPSQCTLSPTGTLGVASCSVGYTPTSAGSNVITASYSGSLAHAASQGQATVQVSRRSTGTTVSCSPSSVAVDDSTTCTATVTDSSGGTKSTPSGTVSWSSDGAGGFSPASCTLDASGQCSVSYTPSAVGTGTHTVTGSYGGDAKHDGSSGSDTVMVSKRSTGTTVSCTPSSLAVDDSTTCTATVTDSSGGTKSTPSGTVSWSSDGAGGFSPASCTLDASGQCSVSYTPSAVGTGTHTVTGSYGGDVKHDGSSGSDTVTVSKRSTETTVSCSPNSFRAGGNTTCTATVSDSSGGTKTTPSGTVSWSSDGTGGFSPSASCTLDASGQCSVTYSSTKAGTDKITASSAGDAKHDGSTGSDNVTVRPGPPANVTVAPAEATNTAGEQHCVTATVKDAYGNTVEAGIAVYFSVSGANPTGPTPKSTDSGGQATFCYIGTKAGVDTIKAVADRDDPPNGPDADDPSGTAKKTYNPGPPANVAVSPASATNPVRTQHCVTATVTDRFDNPVQAGIDVYFSVSGANPTSSAVKVATDASGKAQFCYTGKNGGTDTIKAVADKDKPPNGADAGDPFGTASKTWLSNIPCKVQGTGTISSTQQFNFGVDYSAGAPAPVGSATYIDSGQGKQFSSTRIDGLVCFGVSGGAHAIFFGRGLVNGVPVSDFQIDIDDLGPGPGTDKFAIQWPGYAAGGTLVTGDIQITLK